MLPRVGREPIPVSTALLVLTPLDLVLSCQSCHKPELLGVLTPVHSVSTSQTDFQI